MAYRNTDRHGFYSVGNGLYEHVYFDQIHAGLKIRSLHYNNILHFILFCATILVCDGIEGQLLSSNINFSEGDK